MSFTDHLRRRWSELEFEKQRPTDMMASKLEVAYHRARASGFEGGKPKNYKLGDGVDVREQCLPRS